MNTIDKWLERLPVLKRDTNPALAAVIGFLTGGIGLAIYFRSFTDCFAPVAAVVVALMLNSTLAGTGALGGAVLAALYGYLRALDSNARRQAASGNQVDPTAVQTA
jgi:hypothetical protein